MSVGTGIFLSALLLSAVILFVATKDRWNWKRILKWGLLLPTTLAASLGIGLYIYDWQSDRPVSQVNFNNIPITATPADVKFLKGEPTSKEGDNRWLYNANHEPEASNPAKYIVKFKDNHIHYIMYFSGESIHYHPYLLGFSDGSSYEDVQTKLGTPSHTSQSYDELNRIISYDKLNVFFSFREGRVYAYGIYQPEFGPLKFQSQFQRESE
ncbi:hypothetical protein [Pseudomonas gingeri]|uniref:Uncharacterized protein n=1 Tax=Pseudomonas gingeri TaxID=117681 RepID=A0A7Y7YKJ8_9PSED|nr:hypothetical protein [Pseudomonas gingeri]NWB32089.1 hypothetical protein [Pseudomonas gingeri]NWC37516.1 hypothetical protein [Pseudomonas gingeri]